MIRRAAVVSSVESARGRLRRGHPANVRLRKLVWTIAAGRPPPGEARPCRTRPGAPRRGVRSVVATRSNSTAMAASDDHQRGADPDANACVGQALSGCSAGVPSASVPVRRARGRRRSAAWSACTPEASRRPDGHPCARRLSRRHARPANTQHQHPGQDPTAYAKPAATARSHQPRARAENPTVETP